MLNDDTPLLAPRPGTPIRRPGADVKKSVVLSELVKKVVPGRWKLAVYVLILLLPLAISEVTSFVFPPIATVTACSLSLNGTFTIDTCFAYGLVDSLQGLQYKPKVNFGDRMLLIVFIVMVLLIEAVILTVRNMQDRCLQLLPYKIYVAVQKGRIIMMLVLLLVATVMYAILKIMLYDQHLDPYLQYTNMSHGVYVIYDAASSWYDTLLTLAINASIFIGPLKEIFVRLSNLYNDLDLKTIIKNAPAEALNELAELCKLELSDLQQALGYLGIKTDISYIKDAELEVAIAQLLERGLPFKDLPYKETQAQAQQRWSHHAAFHL